MARSKAELERTQKRGQNGLRLHLSEVLSNANARSSAKWQIGVTIMRLRRIRLKAAGIEPLRLAPKLLVAVHGINGHVDRRSGSDQLIAKLHVSSRRPDYQRHWRIEADRLLNDLARVGERVDVFCMNGAAPGCCGNLALDPLSMCSSVRWLMLPTARA